MSKEAHMNYLRRKTADEAELWAADRIEELEAERDEYRIKHEVACSTLELVKERRDAVQRALAAQCKHTKDLEAERDELLALVIRYRKETPLGHQPHMIAHLADAAIAKGEKNA